MLLQSLWDEIPVLFMRRSNIVRQGGMKVSQQSKHQYMHLCTLLFEVFKMLRKNVFKVVKIQIKNHNSLIYICFWGNFFIFMCCTASFAFGNSLECIDFSNTTNARRNFFFFSSQVMYCFSFQPSLLHSISYIKHTLQAYITFAPYDKSFSRSLQQLH